MKTLKSIPLAFGIAALLAGSALAADPAKINWSKVPAVNVPLFYPGQSSYEWLRSAGHPGAGAVKGGSACTMCHGKAGDEKARGAKLVAGGPLEPTPVKGKNGYVDLAVQVAYDDKNAYIRYQWKTNAKPTNEYPFYRFDGKDWKVYGGPRLDKPVQEGKQPPIYEDRASIMIDDGKVPMFAQQGCWLTCHDGERDLKPATKEEVAANPAMQAYKKADVRKYLPASRSDPGDWKTGKSVEGSPNSRAAGVFVVLTRGPATAPTRSVMPTTATCSNGVISTRARILLPRTWTPRPSSRNSCSTPPSSVPRRSPPTRSARRKTS